MGTTTAHAAAALLLILLYQRLQPSLCDDVDDLVGTTNVSAVVGKNALIPCNIQPENPEDRVYMVLWFRETGGKPIYSFDVRGRSLSQALHWSDPSVFGARASFDIASAPASLIVMAVEQEDEGVYRCRVDFKNSPTRNFILNLVSVVPPHQVILYNSKALDLAGVVGPLVENENFTIFCEVRGGKPEPSVSWSMDNTEALDHEIVRRGHLVIVSRLQVTGARRDWLNRNIICQASNTDLIPPLKRSARIELHLPPTMVQIALKPEVMYADERYYLTCVSIGSRPAADLVWYNDGQIYGNTKKIPQRIFTNDTCTISTVLFIPKPHDDGKRMECVSRNSVLGISTSDGFQMSVLYKPDMTIIAGNTYDPQEIRVNDDIYFECEGQGNPPIKNYTWFFNGKVIGEDKKDSEKKGLSKNQKRLIIRRVDRRHRGLWSCQAANRLGAAKPTAPIFLRVRYKPVCAQEKTYVGVKLYDRVNLRCTVHSDPDILDFTWIFKTKKKRMITKFVSGARTKTFYNGHGTTSELPLLISSEMDYGELLCYANNSVGRMEKPCVIEVVVPSAPDPPAFCTTHRVTSKADTSNDTSLNTTLDITSNITENTTEYLRITCLTGYSGGQPMYLSVDAIDYMHYPPRNRTLKVYGDPGFAHEKKPYWPYPNPEHFYNSYENATFNITRADVEDLNEEEVVGISAHNQNGESYAVLVLFDFYGFKQTPATEKNHGYYSTSFKVILGSGIFAIICVLILLTVCLIKVCLRAREGNNSNSIVDTVATQPVTQKPRAAFRPPTPPPSPKKNLRISLPAMEMQGVVMEQFLDGTYRIHRPISTVEETEEEIEETNFGPCLGSDEYPDAESPIAPYASSRIEMLPLTAAEDDTKKPVRHLSSSLAFWSPV